MLFTTPSFLFAFFPLVVAVYFSIPSGWRGIRNVWLLLSSFFFYGVGEPHFVAILAVSCLVNWGAGFLVAPGRPCRRLALGLSIAANVALLGRFKYLVFGITQCNLIFGTSLSVPSIALPLGISFFTFQAMSYVADVFRGISKPRRNPLDVALYIVLFPQLIAGPIVRYETIADELRGRHENWGDFADGLCRFVKGFAKKMLLANPLAIIADSAFDGANWIPASLGGGPTSVSLAWLGALAFTLQIYFDFSGYSDMAIGMGRMFGFHFQENFLHPYVSKSISEFWRRWHVSMGTWFRDYVYFPLGGSRVRTRMRLVANLFVVWFLTGLWHGANWTFICWGLMFFVLIVIDKLLWSRIFREGFLFSAVSRFWTLFFVICGWVLFRADSLDSAWSYLRVMFHVGGVPLSDAVTTLLFKENAVLLVVSLLASLPLAPLFRSFADRVFASPGASVFRAIIRTLWISALFVASLSFVAKGAHNPFLYFNF